MSRLSNGDDSRRVDAGRYLQGTETVAPQLSPEQTFSKLSRVILPISLSVSCGLGEAF